MDYPVASVADVARSLGTTPNGLDADTVRQRLTAYGKNQIEDGKAKTVWQIPGYQLTDVMILVLMAAAVISAVVGEVKSTYVIAAIIVLNAIVGFVQEFRAEKAMEALKKMAINQARVRRDGQISTVPTADLVPGDVTLLEAGNIIPADVRFIETHALKEKCVAGK